jgi:hypothetical protein
MKALDIRKRLKEFFPFWKPANIILTDPEYDDIDSYDLRKVVIDIPARGDCDDYARELWCYLRHLQHQWPVGICLLNKVAGTKTNHAMVVSVCNNGVYLIEPQAVWDIGLTGMQKMWKAHPSEDHFYFVYI